MPRTVRLLTDLVDTCGACHLKSRASASPYQSEDLIATARDLEASCRTYDIRRGTDCFSRLSGK